MLCKTLGEEVKKGKGKHESRPKYAPFSLTRGDELYVMDPRGIADPRHVEHQKWRRERWIDRYKDRSMPLTGENRADHAVDR